MDFTRNPRRTNLLIGDENLSILYPHDLQLYNKTPSSNISLHEFEEMALERLKALKALETVSLRGHIKGSSEWRANFSEELNKQGLKSLANLYSSPGNAELKNQLEMRRRDHISHFILCLAYCRTDELRHWLINREIELFQTRFDSLAPDGLKTFLQVNKLEFQPIPKMEKQSRFNKLQDVYQYMKGAQIEQMDFYKIPFRKVLDLVRGRRALMEKGYCYIAATDLGNVLTAKLRQEIAHTLAVLRHNLAETSEDKRLDAVLRCLLEQHEAGSYQSTSQSVDTLRVEDLDEVSKRSFPPCMRRLHETLRTKHHLRHGGRQQYQLFLKEAGLPIDEALRFWRMEFMKVMAPDKFEKQYSYNIRHNYGKEGNRTNYSAYGCRKIIQSQPGPEDCNGCPFRHCKPQELRRLLLSYGISTKSLTEIMEYTDNQMYILACQKLFVVTHPDKGVEFGLSHPNQYYNESRQIITGVSNKQEKPAAVSTPNASVSSPVVTPAGSSKLSTPVSTKTSAPRTTPAPARRALPTTNKPASTKDADTSKNVSSWLDEPDEDMMKQIEAMETQ